MMIDLLVLTQAFAAGVLSLFSPCALPLLPGYISYYLGSDAPVSRAILGGIASTVALIATFSLIGALISSLGTVAPVYALLLEPIVGLILILLGFSMWMGKTLPFFGVIKSPTRKGITGLLLFGVTYGLAIIVCSAQLFFAILLGALTAGGLLNGIAIFVAYAVGIGLPLIATSILVAKAKELALQKIINAAPRLQKIGSVLLVLVGVYLIYLFYVTP